MPTVKSYQKQKEKEQVAYNYFLSQGYSPEATAGIVGNLVYESGLNTTARGDIGFKGGDSYGIAQFRGKRLQDLKKRYGDKWTDFNNQLDFVRHELETTHKKAGNILKNTRDVYQAGQTFSDLYEIPAKKYKNNPDRQKKVNKIYSSLSGTTPTQTSNTPISDQAIANVNLYFENTPTTDVKDLVIIEENVNFDAEPEVEVTEEKVEDQDIKEVKKQTAEYNFLEEYKALVNQQESPQEIVQTEPIQQQLPQQDLTDIFNQVSEFIDTPTIAQQGTTVGNLTPLQTTDVESQRQWLNDWNKNRIIDGVKINTNSEIPFSSDIYTDDLNYGANNAEKTLGEFDNVTNRLILDTNYQSKPGIPVHEFTHRYQKYADPSIYSKYINEPISTALGNTQGSSEYHGNVDENQAELNRLRYNSGFKPDQVITPQDLQKYNSEEYNLKHFSQEQLIDVLNKTAYNGNNSSQRYAQQGISLSIGVSPKNIIDTFSKSKIDKRKSSDLVKVKSSLNEGEVNYVRTSRPTDKPLKREKLVEQQASEDFINWYSDPATKEKFTRNTGLDADRLQDFIGKGMRTPMREAQQQKDIEYLSKLGADAVYQSPYVKKANNDDINTKTGEILYQKQRESTSYSKAPNMRNVLGHEIIHGSSLDGVLGGALQRALGDVNNQKKGTFKRDREYLSHPEETYGNFHMFRKNLGLTPGQKINEQELQKLVKEKGLDEEIFYKAYDDDKIVKAINTIAQNAPQIDDNIEYAQTGGKVVKDNNGYWNPNNWGKSVEISSPYITMEGVKEPLVGISNQTGERKLMLPENDYHFKNTKQVTEHPLTENEKEFLKYIANKNNG